MDRRRYLAGLGAVTAGSFAGCSGAFARTTRHEDAATVLVGDGDTTKAAFGEFVDEMREKYGTAGVWGRAETEPDHGGEFADAWTTSLGHGDGASDHAVALYRFPAGPNGADSYQAWLWNGVDGASVRRLEAGLAVTDAVTRVGVYSPAQDYGAGDRRTYPVESSRLDVDPLVAEVPLASGTVGVGPDTEVGDGGAYFPYWEGSRDGRQSLVGTCELRVPTDAPGELSWSVAVELGE